MKARSLESALEKVSRVITDRYGLRLVCRGDRCQTNGRTICLPSLPEDVPDGLLGAIRGWADHECAHAKFTRTQLGPMFHKEHGQGAFVVLNSLEDARVERLMGRRYPGASINIEEAFRFISKRASRQPAGNAFGQFIGALYTRASGRPDQGWISRDAYELAGEFAAEIAELRSCRSTRQVAALALKVWDKVKDRLEAEAQPSNSEVSSSPRESLPSSPGDGEQADASPLPDHSPPDTGQQGSAQAQSSCQAGSLMDRLPRIIEAELGELQRGSPGPYRVYTTRYDVVEVPALDKSFDYHAETRDLRPHISALRRRLLQSLMGKRESRWLGDRPRGRLNPRALHRIPAGRSERIFRQRIQTEAGKAACTLLLDLSSSMSGAQIGICRKLALVFAETLSVLGFPTEIIGFSTVDRDLRQEAVSDTGMDAEDLARRYTRLVPLYHAVFKAFEEPWRKAAGRLGEVRCRALTPLGESLLFAGKRLAQRPERRKVLFCLTDGHPVVGAWDEQVTLQHACEAVQKLSSAGIEPVGVGIREESVEQIFPRHAVISELEELPRGFLGQLCSVLTHSA